MPGAHARLERVAQQPERDPLVHLAPALPAEHRRRVEEHDPLHVLVQAGVEEGHAARLEVHLDPLLGGRSGPDARRQLALHVLVDSLEDVALALVVVVEGPARDVGGLHDLLDRDARVALAREQVARDADQLAARGLRLLGLLGRRRHGADARAGLSGGASRTSPVRGGASPGA